MQFNVMGSLFFKCTNTIFHFIPWNNLNKVWLLCALGMHVLNYEEVMDKRSIRVFFEIYFSMIKL